MYIEYIVLPAKTNERVNNASSRIFLPLKAAKERKQAENIRFKYLI